MRMQNTPHDILTVTLNPAIDKTMRIKGFELGKDHRFEEPLLSAGGKGLNVSRALKKLGIKNLATGFLGGPDGEFIQGALCREKIDQDFIAIKCNTRTSLTVIDTATRRSTRLLEPGPKITGRDLRAFKKHYAQLLRRCKAVVLSGRNIPGAGDDIYRVLIGAAHRAGRLAVLDTSGLPLKEGIKACPDVIKPNLAEAEFLLGEKLRTQVQLKKAVKALLKKGCRTVVISLGRKGAIAADEKDCYLAKVPVIKKINTVGCGDTMIAGFLAGYAKGQGLARSLSLAVAAGTANALTITPGGFTRLRVWHLAGQVKIKRMELERR